MCVCGNFIKIRCCSTRVPIIYLFLSSLISAFTFKIELRQSLCGTGVGTHTWYR